LTKAHIRYLEGELIDKVCQAGRALVQNGQISGSRLPESDREDLEVFYEKINQLLPVLGVELLVPLSAAAAGSPEEEVLMCELKGLRATGHRIPNGFLVLQASQAVLHDRPSSQKYPWAANMRRDLRKDGVLVEERLLKTPSSQVPVRRPQPYMAAMRTALSCGKTPKGRR
jgi:hypothetical protein